MAKVHEFAADNEIGKRGERIFMDFLCRHGYSFTDVSDDREYQKQDVDVLIESKKMAGKQIPVEIKNDTMIHRTGNIFFETMSNVDYATDGCFQKTKADIMVIVSEPEKSIYLVDAQFLKKYVTESAKSLRFISRVPGSNSCGYLIPVRNISDRVKKVSYG